MAPSTALAGPRPGARTQWLTLPVAALAATAVVAVGRPGPGTFLAGLVSFATAILAAPRRPWPPLRILAATVVVLLLAAASVRDAGWLSLLCLLVAVPFAVPAITGRAVGWRLPAATPATGVLVGVPVLGATVVLFASANPVFARLVGLGNPRITLVSLLAGVALFSLVALSAGLRTPPAAVHPLLPLVPLALLDLVFGVFLWTERGVVFALHNMEDSIGTPDGPSFAEYLHAGYAEPAILLLSLVFLAAVGSAAPGRRRHPVLVSLSAVLCLLNLGVAGFAGVRMLDYGYTYGLTRTRMLGLTAEAALVLLLVLLLLTGIRPGARWIPAAATGVVLATVLTLVAVNPDRWIARVAVDGYLAHETRLDAGYLSDLSADAIVEVDRLPDDVRACVLAGMVDGSSAVEPGLTSYPQVGSHAPPFPYVPWYAANTGRVTGRAAIRARPIPDFTPRCRQVFPAITKD